MKQHDDLIRRWREATIDPAMADHAELEVRRLLADREEADAKASEILLKDKRSVTRGHLDLLADGLGGEVAWLLKVERREALKREHELHNRIARLEAKLFPAGG